MGGMNASELACLRTQLARKHEELEALVQRGLPFTDPAVVAMSEELDRLVLMLQGRSNPVRTPSQGPARVPGACEPLEDQHL